MTLSAKTEIRRPLAATLILLAGVVLGCTLAASMLVDLWAARAERDTKAEFMSRSLASAPRAAARRAAASLSVQAESETLAAARVDELLRATALDVGAAVLSSQAEAKPDEVGPHRRIALDAVVEGRIEAVQHLLYRLETGAPLVIVDDVALQPSETAATGTDPRAPLLRATLTLSAFWAKPVR